VWLFENLSQYVLGKLHVFALNLFLTTRTLSSFMFWFETLQKLGVVSKARSSRYSKANDVFGWRPSKVGTSELGIVHIALFSNLSTARAGEKICCAPVLFFPLREKDKQHAAEQQTSPEAAA